MSEFNKQLVFIHEALRREEIRCICVLACVFIVLASAMGAMFYCIPPPISAACEPVTCEYTDATGTTTVITRSGNTTITVVTDSSGRVISTSIISGRRSRVYTRCDNAADRKAKQERKAAERAERKAQREARRLEKEAAKLERQAEKLRQKAERYK